MIDYVSYIILQLAVKTTNVKICNELQNVLVLYLARALLAIFLVQLSRLLVPNIFCKNHFFRTLSDFFSEVVP